MLAVNGYYDGNFCLLEEKVSKKPQKVIMNEPRRSVGVCDPTLKNHLFSGAQGFPGNAKLGARVVVILL